MKPSLRAGLAACWFLALGGVVLGVVWKLLAPVARIRIDVDGSGYYLDPSPRQYIQADLVFAGLSLVIALLAAWQVRARLRDHLVAAVASLAIGGEIAALIGWRLGEYLGRLDKGAAATAKAGTIIRAPLELGLTSLLLVLPVAACAGWLLIDLAVVRRGEPVLSPDVRSELLPPTSA